MDLLFLALPELSVRGQQWSQNDFTLHKPIGKSRFGLVHLATNRRSGEQVALKILDKAKLTEQRRMFLEEELYLLQKLCYEHIIKVRGWFEDGPNLFIMLEYAECLDILQYIRSGRFHSIKVPDATSITRQILSALSHLHDRGILHRNVVANTVLLKPFAGPLAPGGRTSLLALLAGFSCTVVVRKTTRRCCSQPGNEACGFRPAAYAENLSTKIDSWYVGILMFHMVTGYIPAAFPTSQRLSDQLIVAAPGEYVKLAVSLANEKSFERPTISDALQDCTKVLQAVVPREDSTDGTAKVAMNMVQQPQYVVKQAERLPKHPELPMKILEKPLRLPEKAAKTLEGPAKQPVNVKEVPAIPSKQPDSCEKSVENRAGIVEPSKKKTEIAIKKAEDPLKQFESSTDQPHNLISIYHGPIKECRTAIEKAVKPYESPTMKSNDSTKLMDSPTRKTYIPIAEPESPIRPSKGHFRQHEMSLTHSGSCLRHVDMSTKKSHSLVAISKDPENKLMPLRKQSENSSKQSEISMRTSRITMKLVEGSRTKSPTAASSQTSDRGSPNLLKLIEHFSKQSPNLTSLPEKSVGHSQKFTRLAETPAKKSIRQSESPANKLMRQSESATRKSTNLKRFEESPVKKLTSQRKQTGIISRTSQSSIELTGSTNRRSPKRMTRQRESLTGKSPTTPGESEGATTISLGPGKLMGTRKSRADMRKIELPGRKSPAPIIRSQIRRGTIGIKQYSTKVLDSPRRRSQNFARKSQSPAIKPLDFTSKTERPVVKSLSPGKFVETPSRKSRILTKKAENLRHTRGSPRLVDSRSGKSQHLTGSPKAKGRQMQISSKLCEGIRKQSRSPSKEGASSPSKQAEKHARRSQNLCKAAEEVSKQSDEEPSP